MVLGSFKSRPCRLTEAPRVVPLTSRGQRYENDIVAVALLFNESSRSFKNSIIRRNASARRDLAKWACSRVRTAAWQEQSGDIWDVLTKVGASP